MLIRVLYFATCREIVGEREGTLELPEGSSITDLISEIGNAHTRFQELEKSLMVSVNQTYVERDYLLKDGDEVAFIPPVSGG